MNLLVTAGNTQVPIDRVRCLTNIFTGRTGAGIARTAHERGHRVLLATSHPEAVESPPADQTGWRVWRYSAFDDLEKIMNKEIAEGSYDAIIHSAAVSDYISGGIFAPAPGTRFAPESGAWSGAPPALVDRAAGKVKSDEPELWLRLVRAPKLVDRVRTDWHFRGVLVKFKLEVGIDEPRLLEIAERSRRQSDADLMVANTLEGAATWAYLGPLDGVYQRISRRELAERVLDAVERKHRERTHG
jgi:phosphopantothenoylcysteine synthetase/decarboxylase